MVDALVVGFYDGWYAVMDAMCLSGCRGQLDLKLRLLKERVSDRVKLDACTNS